MQSENNSKEVVLSYVKELDAQHYDAAKNYLKDGIRIMGNSSESFNKPGEFIEMLRRFQGKYDMKKVFADGNDVCLFYDLSTPVANVFMCSWYKVEEGKIASIQTVFDPQPFSNPLGTAVLNETINEGHNWI
jgi:hypothetical protein